MVRVKRGTLKVKKRKRLLKLTKGYRWGRKNKRRMAQEAIYHAWKHAYRGRKEKKRTARRLWQVRINAALREKGLKYSEFIHRLKKQNIRLNRKSLSELAMNYPAVFSKVVEEVKG